MPINVTNIDALDKFYGALTSTTNNLGLSQLWLVGINSADLERLANLIDNEINLYEGNNNAWNVSQALPEAYKSSWFLGDTYYLYAQGAVFPGDGISVTRQGSDKTGALKGLVGEHRNDLPTVTITFLETNQSVADILFRPWSILAGFKSLKDSSIRIPIQLVCFQKDGPKDPLVVRKEINLVRAVPISIDSEEYNYSADKVISRQIEFVYDKYYVVAQNNTMSIDDAFFESGYSEWAYNQVLKVPPSKNLVLPDTSIDKIGWPVPENNPEFVKKIADAENPIIDAQADIDTGDTEKTDTRGIDVFLDSVKDVIETAAGIYTTVEGKVDDIQSETTRILRSVGLDKQANRVDDWFEKTEDSVLQPVGDVIGTGIEVIGGIEAAQRLGRDIVNITDPNTGQVWDGKVIHPQPDLSKPLPETPDKQLPPRPVIELPQAQNLSLLDANDFLVQNQTDPVSQNQANVTDDRFNTVQTAAKSFGKAEELYNTQIEIVKTPAPKINPEIPFVTIL